MPQSMRADGFRRNIPASDSRRYSSVTIEQMIVELLYAYPKAVSLEPHIVSL
jgi:hypothetical protein